MFDSFHDLSLRELELFVLASRTHSLREVARQSDLLPAHVSKIMKRMEEKLGQALFKRTATGIILTPEGLSLVDKASQICELSREMDCTMSAPSAEKIWTFGSISFLTTYLLAPKVHFWKTARKNSRFRLIEFTHNDLVAHGLKGAFEMAVHIEELEWTRVWESYCVGKMTWRLYSRSDHPLQNNCKEHEVAKFPFVVPTDWGTHGYNVGEDFCPLSVRRRLRGHEAATAETALEICRHSDQLTFVPELLAATWVSSGKMKEIRVSSWPSIEKEIFLSVRADMVPKNLATAVSGELKKTLKK